jgi:hypothetical protein
MFQTDFSDKMPLNTSILITIVVSGTVIALSLIKLFVECALTGASVCFVLQYEQKEQGVGEI